MNKVILYATAAALAAGFAAGVNGQSTHQEPRDARPAAVAHAPFTPGEAKSTALSLASLLEDSYWSPEIGRRYAEALRGSASAGVYDAASAPEDFAQDLTRQLQEVAQDRHLRIMHSTELPQPRLQGNSGPGSPGNPDAIEAAGWLAPGVAYIRFNLFPMDEAVTDAARHFMEEHATAMTMIFDLRRHRGGGLAQMDAMFPFLFEEETVLSAMETRASVAARMGSMESRFSMRKVPGGDGVVRREHYVKPHPSEHGLFDAEVIVLTSNLTASASEAFALAMKATGRGTLVGETTAGAGNYGGFQRVTDRFSAFIPVGVTYDPVSGARWEGSGIEPHVMVPADRALVEALVRSDIPEDVAENISARISPAGPFKRREGT